MIAARILRTAALGAAILLTLAALAIAVVFPQHWSEIAVDLAKPVGCWLVLALVAHGFVVFRRRAA